MTEDWRAVVAVDLSKAFDNVNHNFLLAKLKAYGFCSTATNLICRNVAKVLRLRVFVLNRNVSKQVLPRDLCLVHFLLFNIHINDVNCSVSNMALRLYADDTTGYNSDTWSLALQFMVNKNLSSLPTWFKQNLLSINNT